MNTTTTAPVEMPVIDSPLDPEIADGLGDELLLATTAGTKTQSVTGSGRSSFINRSGESRAWTSAGNVD